MLAEKELAEFAPKKDTVLTIGVFDGVHLGHKYLISQLKEQARQHHLLTGVVTFRQHPQEVLSPGSALPHLTSLEEKVGLLKNEGVDIVVALTFDHELAKLTTRQFVTLLKKHLRMVGLVIGPDFALGKGRAGNAEALRKLGEEMGFTVTVVPPAKINSEVVSSTAIRQALAKGDMDKVVRLIGRTYSLQGKIVTGVGRGAQLGFPTANLEVEAKRAIPADGVYATRTHIDGIAYQSMTNIGRRPTFGGQGRTIETYILDYHDDLYNRELKIDIIERLREEKRFANADELKKQLTEDIKRGKAILESRGRS